MAIALSAKIRSDSCRTDTGVKLLLQSRVNIPEQGLEEWKGGGFSAIHSGDSILLIEKDSLYGNITQ